MPTLKQITCNVEWLDSDVPLPEYQTIYADGFVETYVAVPPVSTAFSIHLRSHGYIAPGLAMFIYMDGEYQSNRNRSNLKIPGEARTWKQTEVDFKVRQKEEPMPDGSFSGKQWRFESLKTTESLPQNVAANRPGPQDPQYFGTIEVVVLRCFPNQATTKLASSNYVTRLVPRAQPHVASSPDTSSSSSSDEESTSSESVASVMAGMFDGTADYVGRSPYPRQYPGNVGTRKSGNASGAPIRRDQSRDSPHSRNWQNWVVPDSNRENRTVPESNGPNRAVEESDWQNWVVPESKQQNNGNTKNQNSSSGNARHGNYEPSTYHGGSHYGASRSSPRAISVRSNHPHTGNAANRTGQNSAWTQPQEPPPQAAPAVVINVSHGTPQPATFSSSASNRTTHIKNTEARGWQNSAQPDKIDEYLAGTNQSPEGSHQSRASKQSHDSQVWPPENDNQFNDNGVQNDNAYHWHNTSNHEAANENQWPPVEDTHDSNGEHGVSGYPNDNHPWDNTITGSQPLESLNKEAQNISNKTGWVESNNVSNQMPYSAKNIKNQARYEKMLSSMHPSPSGQVPPQHSPHSSYKSSFSHHSRNEATQHITPPMASHVNGSMLPMFIDPRPRPHWFIWKQPQRSSSFSKAEFPPVEPVEPLNYVPWEVAQRNKMSHQVYLSQPAGYVHKRASPRYMDDFSRPYAVFIFKYRSKAILEQILNTTLMEPGAQEKERLQNLSKEELIDQILRAKAYKDKNMSGSVSSHTARPEEPAHISRDAAANDGRPTRQPHSQPPNKAAQYSQITSTNPEHHWDRQPPILNTMPPHPEAKVHNWLGSGVGGSNSGSGNKGIQNAESGNWNQYGTPGAWPGDPDPGSDHKGTQNAKPANWNQFGTAGAWTGENDGQQTGQQKTWEETGGANGNGNGNERADIQW